MKEYGHLKIFMWIVIDKLTGNSGMEQRSKKVMLYHNVCWPSKVESTVDAFIVKNKSLRYFDIEYEFVIKENQLFKKVADLY
jgi:hypothetical protein